MKRCAAALFFVLLVSAQADMLTLRNGTTVTGNWMGMNAQQISFQVNDQIRTYPKADVLKVTFGPEPIAPLKSVAPGMTKDQVAAILGKPDGLLAEAGTKQIYSYKNLKVTFVDGNVTDIQ
jgi:hypothetical protein